MAADPISFLKVKVTITPAGGSEAVSECLLSLDSLGSSREVNKLKCLNDSTILAVGAIEYESPTFEVPDDETVDSFWDITQIAYTNNTMCDVVIEFDNLPDANPGAVGTTIVGQAKVTAAKLQNNSTILTTTFTIDWNGSVSRVAPVPGTP